MVAVCESVKNRIVIIGFFNAGTCIYFNQMMGDYTITLFVNTCCQAMFVDNELCN